MAKKSKKSKPTNPNMGVGEFLIARVEQEKSYAIKSLTLMGAGMKVLITELVSPLLPAAIADIRADTARTEAQTAHQRTETKELRKTAKAQRKADKRERRQAKADRRARKRAAGSN
jgi:hypothetical protein